MSEMLSIDDAMSRLLDLVTPIHRTATVPASDAIGRVLSDDIHAPVSLPPFNSSAMDGYAVKSDDCDVPDRTLKVIGTSYAGKPFSGSVPSGSAVRIFTGAELPDSCDAVVLQEDVRRKNEWITTDSTVHEGENIRYIGHDVKHGTTLLHKGKRLSAFDIAWLAASGVDRVRVADLFRVALFSTGNELQEPGCALGPGQIYDSNRAALIALLREKPVQILDLGRLRDDPAEVREKLTTAQRDADVIITSGGVSVGDADYVRPIIEDMGELTFWNVALKPGKPIAVAKLKESWFFGLPGNPVSTIVTYLLFVSTAIDRLCGMPYKKSFQFRATLTNPIKHKQGRREFQRGWLKPGNSGALTVHAVGDQSSNRLATFSNANSLIVAPESKGDLAIGDEVEVLLLPNAASHILQEN